MNIEYDIKQSFDKIEARFEKIDKVAEDVSGLKTNLVRAELELEECLVRVKESLKGEIKVLNDKIDGISKRVY